MSDHTLEPDAPTAQIQIDVYGVKARASPAADEEPTPRTWRETGERINRALMRFAAGVFVLAADLVEGAGRLVRGLTGLPGCLSQRIGEHGRPNCLEERQQRALEAGRAQLPDRHDAARSFEAKELGVSPSRPDDGSFLIVAFRPEVGQRSEEPAQLALPGTVSAHRPPDLDDKASDKL